MNEAEVRAVPHMNGYFAHFRKLHRSGWHAVEINGVAQLYDTAEQAENAAYRALMEYLFGHGIVRSGEKASVTKAEAEFAKIFPGKGRRPVEVTRITPTQSKVLANAAAGLPLGAGRPSTVAAGWMHSITSCRQRGWIGDDGRLTAAGKRVMANGGRR